MSKFHTKNDLFLGGDQMMVKPYKTANEKKKTKEVIVKSIIITSFFFSLFIGGVFNILAETFLFWVASVVIIKLIVKTYEHDPRTEQRKRITLAQEKRNRDREYRKKMKAIAEEKEKLKQKEAQLKEMQAVDERLQEAKKPIDWNSPAKPKARKAIIRNPVSTGSGRGNGKRPVRNKKTPIKRSFKKISVDNI
tara:strand:- start:10257 stop:10835 length:579 start_codon:yes stop_codon:yes gene_type:complete